MSRHPRSPNAKRAVWGALLAVVLLVVAAFGATRWTVCTGDCCPGAGVAERLLGNADEFVRDDACSHGCCSRAHAESDAPATPGERHHPRCDDGCCVTIVVEFEWAPSPDATAPACPSTTPTLPPEPPTTLRPVLATAWLHAPDRGPPRTDAGAALRRTTQLLL
jgi:hypothetical protein